MKSIPAPLLANYEAGTNTLVQCVLFTLADGTEVALTSADVDVVVSGRTYLCDPGLTITNIVTTSGLAVDNLELTLLPDELVITETDILAGRWNQTGYQLFEVNPVAPANGINMLMQGTTGNFTMTRGAYRAELRGIEQLLQAGVGAVTQKTCRYRFGSSSHRDGWCRLDLTPYTHTGTLTAVTSAQVWVDSARAEAADYFAEGEIRMDSGPAVGLRFLVKQFSSGSFTLALPAVIRPDVGDSYTAIRGCPKTRDFCVGVGNILNFGGEPDAVGMDFLTKPVDAYS
jgi:uncharacterized phage protein (TIGR02218 family)